MWELISKASTCCQSLIIIAYVVLMVTLVYFWLSDKKKSQLSFPGLAPSDPETGNFGDINKAGSLHEFLVGLHKRFGPIVHFWWGKELTVSLGSAEVWKDVLPLFDRPESSQNLSWVSFRAAVILGRVCKNRASQHRKLWTINSLELIAKTLQRPLESFTLNLKMEDCGTPGNNMKVAIFQGCREKQKVGDETVKKWKSMPIGEHIRLKKQMLAVSLKSIMRSSFGGYFDSDEKIHEFGKLYDTCWLELETQLDGHVVEPGSEREKRFNEALKKMKETGAEIIKHRRNQKEKENHVLLDVMLEEDSHFTSEEMATAQCLELWKFAIMDQTMTIQKRVYTLLHIFDNAMTFIVAGYHTSGMLLTWIIYFLCKDPDVQSKVYKELQDVVGNRDITLDDIGKLTYLRQVIDEGLRTSTLAPWAARYSEDDIVVGGHTIPKVTPMILALGVVLQDPETWPEPERFDPSRFDPEKSKKLHPLIFSPFGFAGKRKCPGYRYAYVQATVSLCMLVKNFKFSLVEGQKIKKVHGLVTRPNEEIWITVEQRKT